MTRTAAVCLALLVVCPLPARAQAQPVSQPSGDEPAVAFLRAYHGQIGASGFTIHDESFGWEGRFLGDVDLLDYGQGRLNFAGEYTVTVGSELRGFDPNQSSYRLDVRATRRFGQTEVAGVFHHVSRHLSDREKTDAIDWNLVGLELSAQSELGDFRFESRLHGGGMINYSYVDYRWQSGVGLGFERDLRPRLTLIGAGSVDFIGTDTEVADRSTQLAAYAEGGVRMGGEAGSLELFAAFERRVDPDPIVRGVRTWGLVGFRIVNR